MRFALAMFALLAATLPSLCSSQEAATSNFLNTRQLTYAKETSTADFVRLVVMRLIFGLASAMGYGESLSNFLGGVFVPPGADYDADDDYEFVPDLF